MLQAARDRVAEALDSLAAEAGDEDPAQLAAARTALSNLDESLELGIASVERDDPAIFEQAVALYDEALAGFGGIEDLVDDAEVPCGPGIAAVEAGAECTTAIEALASAATNAGVGTAVATTALMDHAAGSGALGPALDAVRQAAAAANLLLASSATAATTTVVGTEQWVAAIGWHDYGGRVRDLGQALPRVANSTTGITDEEGFATWVDAWITTASEFPGTFYRLGDTSKC